MAKYKWRITNEGCLEIKPIDGTQGLLECNKTSHNVESSRYFISWPWLDRADSIKKVKIFPGVIAGHSLKNLFHNCKNLASADLTNFDTSHVTDMSFLFENCLSLTSLDLSGLDSSNVTDMSGMFYNCSSLESLDLSDWNTSNVIDMAFMFNGCSSLTNIDALTNWDTSSVMKMSYMFDSCSKLTNIDALTNWKFTSVTDVHGMFDNCSNLTNHDMFAGLDTYVPLNEPNNKKETILTNGVKTDAKQQLLPYAYAFYSTDDNSLNFYGYENKSEVPSVNEEKDGKTVTAIWTGIEDTGSSDPGWYVNYRTRIKQAFTDSSFDRVQCRSYHRWFDDCRILTNIDALTNWNTSNVTNMSYMFANCVRLTNIKALTTWDISNVTDMSYMFCRCYNLTNIDALINWDTANVTNMSYMFANCSSLVSLDLSDWDTSNVADAAFMFNGCSNLHSVVVAGERFTFKNSSPKSRKEETSNSGKSNNNTRSASSTISENESSDRTKAVKGTKQTTSRNEHVQSKPVQSKPAPNKPAQREPSQSKPVQSNTNAQPPTNAGVVVAWIGIVICWIIVGIFAISIVAVVILLLMDCYNSGGEYARWLGITLVYVFTAIAPVSCLVYIYSFRDMAKQGKWTSGASVIAVIVALIVAYILAAMILYVLGVLLADFLSVWLTDSETGQEVARIAYFIINIGGVYEIGGLYGLVVDGFIGVVITGAAIFLAAVCVFLISLITVIWDK